MRKLVLFILMCSLYSCSNSIAEYEELSNQDVTSLKECHLTFNQLRAFNDSLEMSSTRPGGTNFNRVARYDVGGACLGHQVGMGISLGFGPLGYFGSVLLSSAVASAIAAANEQGTPMTDSDLSSFYQVAFNYSKTHKWLANSNMLVPFDPNWSSSDTLLAHINLPNSYSDISLIGRNHNGILNAWEDSLNHVQPNLIRRLNEDPIYNGPQLQYIQNLFSDYTFNQNYSYNASLCFDAIEYVDGGDFDFYFFQTQLNTDMSNISEAYELFFEALDNVNNINDVFLIVNQYINIIESANEFSADERKAVYAGLIVSVYSYQYWN